MTPRTIGRYQMKELMGKGAHSLVYRAHDPRFKRDVAIKLLDIPDSEQQADWQHRFEREVQAAGQLSHRHIATYYDADVEDGQPYVVMEMLKGGTLADRLVAGAMPWARAVRLLLPLAHALAYAHRRGIIHRDVKPLNVMFKSSGTLKLVDLGLARWQEEQGITQTDAARGTLAYMAPEQLQNMVDARSDIYALGLILIEAISGRNPQVKQKLGQTVASLASDEGVNLRLLSGLAPPRLVRMIGRMVAKDPDNRYANSREVVQDLEAVLTHATADWRSVPEAAQVRLANPHRLLLPEDAGLLLSHLFPGSHYQSVELDREFGKGYSGARVFLVHATRSDGSPELPAVVKMGPLPLIRGELAAYDTCIRYKLPAIARIEGEAAFPPGSLWGAIRYALAGEGVRQVESMRSYYQHASTGALLSFLESFFHNMNQLWLYGRAEAGFRRQVSYDGLLPVNLLVAPMIPPPGSDIQPVHADIRLGPWLKPGDFVRLEGFAEVERDETTITVNFAAGSRETSYRLRLGQIEDIDSFQVDPVITGQVVTTRSELLRRYMGEAAGELFKVEDDALLLANGRRRPNPLTNLPELLRQRENVKVACIHGDLNMENILVDERGLARLIDFASARRDHVLHDFLRLETTVVISLLPGTLAAAELGAEAVISFYQQLHCAAFHDHQREQAKLDDEALDKPFQMIRAIRKTAQTCFFNQSDWTEYYRGLVIYLLGALKYKSLDDDATAPLPKQMACLAAAVVQQMLADPPDCGPQRFGRYQVIREIGRGGMGVVFQARDPQMERTVAVKTLPRQWISDPQLRRHLHSEAKTIANLQHPAIVPVHDFGEMKGQPYLVMGYMPGGSLNDRLQTQGPLPAADVLQILGRLAPALDKAHAKGIIHRDIKPANIVFDEEGSAFLADFGIARVSGSEAGGTGFSAGTTAYTSPEQVRGNSAIDARCDIYALGATLFMMLTGQPPYRADTPEALAELHLNGVVPDVRQVRPELPRAWQQVITRAMAKDPGTRFASVGQMEAHLRQRLADKPKLAPALQPVTLPEPGRFSGASRGVGDRALVLLAWVIGAAVVVGLLVLGAISLRSIGEEEADGLGNGAPTAVTEQTQAVVQVAPPPASFIAAGDATYLIALDTSTTMAGEKLDKAVEAVAQFVTGLGARDEVEVYAFDDGIRSLAPLNRAVSVRVTLHQALHELESSGGTALYDAVCQVVADARSAMEADEADGHSRAYTMILLTDGPDSNSEHSQATMLANCLPDQGWPSRMRLVTIGYGEDADPALLTRMANRTGGQYLLASPNDIVELLPQIGR